MMIMISQLKSMPNVSFKLIGPLSNIFKDLRVNDFLVLNIN